MEMKPLIKYLVALLIICLPIPVQTADKWTKTELGLQALSTSLQIIDWGQTLDIAEKPDRYREINPLIGEHPSRGRVNTYFAVSVLSNIFIAHLLPSLWRRVWLGSRIMISGYLVNGNYGIGLRVNF